MAILAVPKVVVVQGTATLNPQHHPWMMQPVKRLCTLLLLMPLLLPLLMPLLLPLLMPLLPVTKRQPRVRRHSWSHQCILALLQVSAPALGHCYTNN